MKIHVLQHVPFEGPGYIAQWAEEHHHELSFTRFYEPDYALPDVMEPDALVIMGGPMSVFDEDIYHWLHTEKIFIEDSILGGKKVLGICLGAQLAAQCLGATVSTAPNKEIGWFPVTSTENTGVLPWFAELFADHAKVLHWHGDKFHIPYGGYELLRSAGNTNQAFLYNDNVLGLQFHLEATRQSLEGMIQHLGDEIQPATFVQSASALLSGAEHISVNQKLMSTILHEFLIGSHP
jgi:GMP synthase-like glutamine amidotransferase